ncbi:hypothetical protein GCM10010295_28140 [Streptomyces intermedius]
MGVCDFPLMDKVCGAVDFATNPAGTVTDGLGAWIAKSAGELASSAADLAAKAVNKTTAIDLNAGWFRDNYELLLPIGLALTVGIFCIQLMTAAWRRDERALAKAAFGTMTGVLFSFSAIAFTTVAITVVDALSESNRQYLWISSCSVSRRSEPGEPFDRPQFGVEGRLSGDRGPCPYGVDTCSCRYAASVRVADCCS